MIGQRFGKLLVLKIEPKSARIRNDGGECRKWLCLCDCGTKKAIFGHSLRRKTTISCGCYQKENARMVMRNNLLKHGKSDSSTYRVWASMIQRCQNPNDKSFRNYGARGIKVCSRWKRFENFLSDMGDKPNGLSIDRINNDGDYEPSNCRWVTNTVNCRNRRTTVRVEFRGEIKCLTEWLIELGLTQIMVAHRIRKGMTVQEAIEDAILKTKCLN